VKLAGAFSFFFFLKKKDDYADCGLSPLARCSCELKQEERSFSVIFQVSAAAS